MKSNKLAIIAKGCNSQVYAYGQGENQVVLKVVSSLNKKEQNHLRNQFQILKALHHKNIIKEIKYQQNVALVAAQGNNINTQLRHTNNILVLEYAAHGSLLQFIHKQTMLLQKKVTLFRDVLEAVRFIHTRNIAHRDIKLQNMLVCSQKHALVVKLSDFGLASSCQDTTFREFKGTQKGYMAPEIFYCRKSQSNHYDPIKADIFALGVSLFALVFLKLPFQFATQEDPIYKFIFTNRLQYFWSSHPQVISCTNISQMQQFKHLFEKLVHVDPKERLSIESIIEDGWMRSFEQAV